MRKLGLRGRVTRLRSHTTKHLKSNGTWVTRGGVALPGEAGRAATVGVLQRSRSLLGGGESVYSCEPRCPGTVLDNHLAQGS